MGNLSQDIKFGFRQLLKRPLLTVAITISLALGIGANSAVFSIVDAILFRPMNVPNTDRLVSLYTSDYNGPHYGTSSYADFVDFRSKADLFEGATAFTDISTTMRIDQQADRVYGIMADGNYFDLFGLKAIKGRTFGPADDQAGAPPAVVLSYAFWQRRFGGDASIVGKTVSLGSNNFTIIGITPESFTGIDLGHGPDIFVPVQMYSLLGFEQTLTSNRSTRQFSIMGRLKPGVDAGSVQRSMEILAGHLAEAYPNDWKDRDDKPREVSAIAEKYARVRPEVRGMLTALAGLFTVLVVLVLLIACSNVSNMLLARATARQREMTVRAALGATRKRLIRQLLTESLELSLFGGILGVVIAPICIKLLTATFIPPTATAVPISFGINERVIILTLAIGLITGLIFGLMPAIHASRTDLLLAMKDEMPVLSGGRRRFGIRNLLVMVQIAVSLVLLIVAGLFIRSLQKAQQVDLGYDVNNVLTTTPDAEFLDSKDTARQLAFYDKVLERVRTLPGVESASFADMVPSGSGLRRSTIRIDEYTPKANESMDVLFGTIAPDYFKTMGMKVIAGREFTDQDRAGASRVAIINETMAHQYWPGQNAIGKKVTQLGSKNGANEVVGVVRDAVAYIYQTSPSSFVYLPMEQNPSPGMTLHVRTKGDPVAILPAVRNEVDQLGQGVTLRNVRTLSELIDQSLLMLRLASVLTGIFGGLALILALVGVFSVINYSTTRRTKEIGIRVALGAQRMDILKLIMKEGLMIVGVGVVLGLLLAFASGQLIGSLMFGSGGTDFSVYIGFPVLLIVISMVACLIPAYMATRIAPTLALRKE
jgi:predicted permease